MAEDRTTALSARSYYGRVCRRALADALCLTGEHIRFAVLLLAATYGVGAATGVAVNAKTAESYIVYPLAALGVVALAVLLAQFVAAPVRLAREASGVPSADRYRERLDLFKALKTRADEASHFYRQGPTALEEFGTQMQHAVRVLREHGEGAAADELELLRTQLLSLDHPTDAQYRDAADQIVQYTSRLVGVHSTLFSDTPEIVRP